MEKKKLLGIIILSLLACVLHAVLLLVTSYHYAITSAFKVTIFMLCPLLYFKAAKEGSRKEFFSLFSMHGNKKNIGLAFLLGFGVFSFIVILFMLLQPLFDRDMVVSALAESGITPRNAIFVFVYIVLINAALEQLFFRGFVFMSLYRLNRRRLAHIYSALLFSFYHIPMLLNALSPGLLILCTVGLVGAGLIFNTLTVKFNSISGSLIVHISANLALNLMIGVYFVF